MLTREEALSIYDAGPDATVERLCELSRQTEFLRRRVKELEDSLSRAQIIDISKMAGDTIKFGATVTIVDEDTDEEIRYQLVGDFESDASNGRISVSSPVARALMGKEVGDSAEVATPGGGRFFEVLKIEYV